jgi:hypothetical protein
MPLIKHPCIHFIFVEIKQYTYKSHCFKIHFHTYTRVQKQIHILYTTCVQMFGNAKIWPYYMYTIKSWISSYKVVKDFFIIWMKFVRVYFSIIRQIGQSNNRIHFYHNMICEIKLQLNHVDFWYQHKLTSTLLGWSNKSIGSLYSTQRLIIFRWVNPYFTYIFL